MTFFFPKLPLLEDLSAYFRRIAPDCLKGMVIVSVQHLLETTGSLFEELINLGCPAGNIFVLGKPYSANAEVAEGLRRLGINVCEPIQQTRYGQYLPTFLSSIARMWSAAEQHLEIDGIRGLIILDDGGRCIAAAPEQIFRKLPVVGVEQTTSGLSKFPKPLKCPVIEVASSAAKRFIEPPIVTDSIVRNVINRLCISPDSSVFGIVGLGSIGTDLARYLVRKGFTVCVYDHKDLLHETIPGVRWAHTLQELLSSSDYILGCTGEDFLAEVDWRASLQGKKTLISCSSEDIEFQTLLRSMQSNSNDTSEVLLTIEIYFENAHIRILRGGFPANFIGTPNSGTADRIQMTRALLLGAVVQAAVMTKNSIRITNSGTMLNVAVQKHIILKYLELATTDPCDYPPELAEQFKNTDWICTNSGGMTM